MRYLVSGAVALLVTAACGNAATGPALGKYTGRATTDAAGAAPHSFALWIARGTCSTPSGGPPKQAYCARVSTGSFVQAPCAGSGLSYDAFFPIAQPMALSARSRIDHVFPLYVADGGAYAAPASGRVEAGSLRLTLLVTGQDVTGTEHYRVDLGADDGVCDSGVVKLTAHHS